MATTWRTEPVMDSLTDNERRGPQIYVHVEFGVSWTKKPPKNHEITYRSRNMRERTPAFPRQVPALNTNYLAAIHTFDQQQARSRQGLRVRTVPEGHHRREQDAGNYHQLQEYYQVPPPPYQQQQREQPDEQRRSSRADSRSSHERGHSAPPPIGENPWDVLQHGGRGGGPSSSRQQPDQWKALPANPSQFRLGEGGMPWSAWSWPFEYQPDTPTNQDDDDDEESLMTRSVPGRSRDGMSPFATSPTMVSTFSPEPSTTPLRVRDHETGRTRELGALSAAMMTVDNGFENQWWNQGQRETVTGNETETIAPEPPRRAFSSPVQHGGGPGPWSASALLDTPASSRDRESSAMDSIVSPITAADGGSPMPAFQSLHRTLSTRSEELFFTER
ncbi:hypothetical protein QBC47DRAFT_45488 [Echria macrotheca]|uniref:Uncharacterized protein n=1 Tax=Echria macrotheca TaxID=438768 RepID=A0AAJ0F3I8_9PEZI|nr:hypothetical protein QBC47DRAFT_45488 [Echria macrotheca]